jgi:hypothetical protein
MSGKSIVIQPRTTQTVSPKRFLVFVVSVLALSAAIVFGSMPSNESAAVADEVDLRVDYAFRHPGETFLVPATPLEQTPDYLTRYLTRHVPVSDLAEMHRSPDYGIRHMADWKLLGFVTSVD